MSRYIYLQLNHTRKVAFILCSWHFQMLIKIYKHVKKFTAKRYIKFFF